MDYESIILTNIEPTQFEKEAIEFMLTGDHPVLEELRSQSRHILSCDRKLDGDAGYNLIFHIDQKSIPLSPDLRTKDHFVLHDVGVKIGVEDATIFLGLWISDRRLHSLEVSTIEFEFSGELTEYSFYFLFGKRNWEKFDNEIKQP